MKAKDVMTCNVISVDPETPVRTVAWLMIEHHISAVPVVDEDKHIIGMVSEGDLLRRWETGTERHRSWWLEAFASNAELAGEYVKSHARRAKDVMSREVVSVTEDTPLVEVADILESERIKRVPVLRDGRLVGIVSRANLVRALACLHSEPADVPRDVNVDDDTIRDRLIAELKHQPWAELIPGNIVVNDRIVHLWGFVLSDEEKQALRVAAENIPGVRGVQDHTSLRPVALPAI